MNALGSIDLLSLFLQQVEWDFYKTESIQYSYSTQIGDNTVEISIKRCPLGSFKSVLRFVARHAHRKTMFYSSRRAQNTYILNKI